MRFFGKKTKAPDTDLATRHRETARAVVFATVNLWRALQDRADFEDEAKKQGVNEFLMPVAAGAEVTSYFTQVLPPYIEFCKSLGIVTDEDVIPELSKVEN